MLFVFDKLQPAEGLSAGCSTNCSAYDSCAAGATGLAGWGDRLTTVFPRQGHYATAPDVASFTTPDLTVERIGDLLQHQLPAFAGREKESTP